MKRLFLPFIVLLLIAGTAFMIFRDRMSATSEQQKQQTEQKKEEKSEFNKKLYSIDEPASPWWIVNKNRPLPKGYVPAKLVVPSVELRLNSNNEQMKLEATTAKALETMFAEAQSEGILLVLSSGYRSEALQRTFYNSYVAQDGQEAADRYSAKPGTSEHQTGMSADIIPTSNKCHLEICFGDMAEGKWLAANSHKFGFIIRYPNGKEPITGYQYEPWHLRYVGIELASELHKQNLTMEEFFGL